MEKQWTRSQSDAVWSKGGSITVSAAAGSGKTSVLTARAVEMICGDDACDADSLLIVTFSNAAAREMKSRIGRTLDERIASSDNPGRLLRQKMLLEQSYIGTMHGFCMELIKENFQSLDIDSESRIGDEKELNGLFDEAFYEISEKRYSVDGDPRFFEVVELLSHGRGDRGLYETVKEMHGFLRTHPFPENWIKKLIKHYECGTDAGSSIFTKEIFDYAMQACGYMITLTRRSAETAMEDEKLTAAYHDALSNDLMQLEELQKLIEIRDWNACYAAVRKVSFQKLRPVRGDTIGKDLIKRQRDRVKTMVSDLCRSFSSTWEEAREDISWMAPRIEALFGITLETDRLYSEKKREHRLLDFADLEQFALQLLVNCDDKGNICRTGLAETLSRRYSCVMVDEFQDTNEVQELIFEALSRNGENVFAVGDIKQSIYRFRQAMPEIFLNRIESSCDFDGEHFPARIFLKENFRSGEGVCDAINYFFYRLMSRECGEIDYNEEQQLISQSDYPLDSECEIVLTEAEDKNSEARYTARRIRQMLSDKDMRVYSNGEYRQIMPGDIAVLLRVRKGCIGQYIHELTALGIPVQAETEEVFFASKEIRPLISLLMAVNNPMLDIELAAAMLSPLGGFSAGELAAIRLSKRGAPFYTALCIRAEQDAHCDRFMRLFSHLRRIAAYEPVKDIIRCIIDATDYRAVCASMPMGSSKLQNLNRLEDYAAGLDERGYKGLYAFCNVVGGIISRGDDIPAAHTAQKTDAVRVMSIHHSKGLEFPVVFICDTARQFNRTELSKPSILHPVFGFACQRRDPERFVRYDTLPLQSIRLAARRALAAEELRLLYVAMTRAIQHIVITAAVRSPRKKLMSLASPLDERGRILPLFVANASNMFEWVGSAVLHHQCCRSLAVTMGIRDSGNDRFSGAPISICFEDAADAAAVVHIEEEKHLPEIDLREMERVRKRLDFKYRYEEDTIIPSKMGVSQASHKWNSEMLFKKRPSVFFKDGADAAKRGTLIHTFMQYCSYEAAFSNVGDEIERLAGLMYFTEEETSSIDKETIEGFFKSRLYSDIKQADTIYREFSLLCDSSDVPSKLTEETGLSEGILLQGVADCIYIKDGKAVIVDYKTDRINSEEAFLQRYSTQLRLYAAMAEHVLRMPVRRCTIYSFYMQKEIEVPLT